MTPKKPIYVTQPYMPPLEQFIPYLHQIWDNKILTNGGPFHERLERALCDYLGVNYISLFSNGTLGLITALQALGVTGEVITTPYSFVATSHSLLWHGNTPVFVDVNPSTLNIDPDKIEAAITPQTSAILAVHCYGNPCDIRSIQDIAGKYNLRVIYDAAHAFGVEDAEGSILLHGDLSVLSFHATKVFNTFEGGAIISKDAKVKERIDNFKNFGFVDETTVVVSGINAKMSEINAAFGLLQLQHMPQVLLSRSKIDAYYRTHLTRIPGIKCLPQTGQKIANYSYFPILVQSAYHLSRDELYYKFKEQCVNVRRYFYPLITEFSMYQGLPSARIDNLPIAADAASKILCLPIFPGLSQDQQDRVIELISDNSGVN